MIKPKRLTTKQKLFVQELISQPGRPATDSYLAVSPNLSRRDATTTASALLKKPHVQEHMSEVIARKYSNIAERSIDRLISLLENPETSPAMQLKCMELLSKWQGWAAPTKVQNLHAKVDLSRFKLPGQE